MKWPLLGAIVFAVASPAGDAARAISSALALAVFSAAWAIVSARRARSSSLRMVGGAAVILVLGFLLSGLYWSGVLWGAPPEKGEVFIPPSAPAGLPPRSSSLDLITLLFPSFFGLEGGGALPGGIAVILIVLLGLRVVWRERVSAVAPHAAARAAIGAFGGVFCLGLFLILLGNSRGGNGFRPVSLFSGFSAGRDLASFALAGLLGTSVAVIGDRESAIRFRPLMVYLILVSFAVVGWLWAGDPAAASRPSVIWPILIYAAFSIVAILGGRAWLGPKRFLRGLVVL
ncbi:MAG: hypothetical protein NTV79_00455, partial [Candidatus Aureabacteria bacterium]|nr:hypothetical protein [Candidatus Auribacterota bacterium]